MELEPGAAAGPAIRGARPGDARAIVALAREGLPAPVLPYTIFGAPGIEAGVRDRIARVGDPEAGHFVVADGGGGAVGFAGFRHLEGSLFLDHLYVAPGRRGQGVGGAVLRAGIARLRSRGEGRLALDVFEGNDRARAWYAALGLRVSSVVEWRAVPLPHPSAAPPGWALHGAEAAAATLAAYGFCQLDIVRARGHRHAVGRIGGRFRTRDPSLLVDGAALAFLASLGVARELFCIAPVAAYEACGAGGRLVARSARMEGDLARVLSRLPRS